MKKNDVRIKLLILIFITLIPLSVLKIFNIKDNYNSSIEAELRSSQDFAEAIHLSFINFLEKTWTSQYAIGSAIVSNPDWNESDIENFMKNIVARDKGVLRYCWISPQGLVIASTYPCLNGENLLDREHVQEIINGKEKVISNLRLSHDKTEIIIPVASAIKVNGNLKGIIVSVIDADNLHSIFPEKRLGEISTFGLIDKNGRVVYRNNSTNIPFEKRAISENSPALRALKGEIVRTYSKQSSYDGTKRMGIDLPMKEIGWSCFVTTAVEDVMDYKIKTLKKDILAFVMVYFISFAVAIMMGNKLINSVRRLKKAAQDVMTGDLNTKVDLAPSDVLGDVGQAFNRMTEGLRNQMKEVEEYNNLKSQFLSTVSHELKTPLNIILGCVQLMEKLDVSISDPFKKSFFKYVKMQKQNSYRLLRLINNLIDITKVEVNHIKIDLVNGDIVKVVEDITMSVVEYTNLKDINVVFDTEIEEKIIAFDADMLERIMLNLLSNAIKFTEQGGTIAVNIYDRGEKVVISVKDDGIGIPENKLQMIFERFTQVDNTLRRKSEGSGIGLSLVKSLVEMHGGSITVKSKLEQGSEFIIELPAVLIENNHAVQTGRNMSNVERIHIEFSDIYM
jgi:signal transduction histidine kinase